MSVLAIDQMNNFNDRHRWCTDGWMDGLRPMWEGGSDWGREGWMNDYKLDWLSNWKKIIKWITVFKDNEKEEKMYEQNKLIN